jgi:hypothetical protein
MTTIRFEDFLASIDLPLLAESLSENWWWLESIRELRPVALTLAGDVFLVDRNNAVFFLDTSYGVLEQVASGNDSFRARLQDEAFTRSILRMDLVDELRSRGSIPKRNECYLFDIPSVGGTVSADRARAGSFQVKLDFLGQLTRGMRDLRVGQAFRVEFPDWPGENSKRVSTVRKHARDRRSFALAAQPGNRSDRH